VTLCAFCRQPTHDSGDLCTYHNSGQEDDWAAGNRIMCNFVHRGIVSLTPPELIAHSTELLLATILSIAEPTASRA